MRYLLDAALAFLAGIATLQAQLAGWHKGGGNPLELTDQPPGLYLLKISGLKTALKLVKQ